MHRIALHCPAFPRAHLRTRWRHRAAYGMKCEGAQEGLLHSLASSLNAHLRPTYSPWQTRHSPPVQGSTHCSLPALQVYKAEAAWTEELQVSKCA